MTIIIISITAITTINYKMCLVLIINNKKKINSYILHNKNFIYIKKNRTPVGSKNT